MSEPAFDELLRRLVQAGVRFVLVGGLAVNAWGVVRGTKDVDVVIESDPENAKRLAAVAVDIGGRVLTGDSVAGSVISIAGLALSGERTLIETRLGALDVIAGLPGVPSYEALRPNAVMVEVGGAGVPVCSLEDLRAMKRAAGRTRDRADLEELDEACGR